MLLVLTLVFLVIPQTATYATREETGLVLIFVPFNETTMITL